MTNAKIPTVKYILSMPEPSTHYFEAGLEMAGLEDNYIDLILPVWRPGRYYIFDFASGIQEFTAKDANGNLLPWHKTNKFTWRVESADSKSLNEIHVSYKVYADEFEMRTRGLDEEHAFVNGTSVFMYSEKHRKLPVTLNVVPYKNWHVTSGLENSNGNRYEFTAPDYDYFVDCPLEIGNQVDYSFDVGGKEHVISFFGKADYDIDKMKKDFTKIIKKNFEFWGSVPYEKYIFIIHCTPKSGGGTEHINSTVIGIKPSDFEDEESYKNILRLVSHEFFHTWNVKQMRPKGITPYDYTAENYAEELWISEGGTSYYDGLMILRTGQVSLDDFFKEITDAVQDEKTRPGYKIQSLAESSFDAWIKFWKRNQNAYDSQSDYYKKGSYLSLILDLEIKHSSKNKHSLDDVYRTIYENYPPGSGYTNSDFIAICEKYSDRSLRNLFNDYLYGTKPIDWEKFLGYAGLVLIRDDSTSLPETGIVISEFEGRIYVSNVLPGSLAEKYGLNLEDEIIAIDGVKADYKTAEQKSLKLNEGEEVRLVLFRNNSLKYVTIRQNERDINKYKIGKKSNPNALQKSVFEKWLGIKW